MKTATLDLTKLPTYLDGSDGSLWQARNAWELIVTDSELASRRFVRVSDLLELLAKNKIEVAANSDDNTTNE